jgi:hypothetical protein
VESVFDFTLPAFELKRVGEVERRMAADGIVEAVDVTPIAFAASIRLWKMVRQTSSGLRVLRNVSTMALSKQFPLPDIEIDSAQAERIWASSAMSPFCRRQAGRSFQAK